MHIYIVCYSQLQSFRKFCWVALTNCFSSIFHFGQTSKLKKGVIPRKNWIKINCGYAHLHIMSFVTTKFRENLLSDFIRVALTNCFSSIFHFDQISKFKTGVIPREKIESKFPVAINECTNFKKSVFSHFLEHVWTKSCPQTRIRQTDSFFF